MTSSQVYLLTCYQHTEKVNGSGSTRGYRQYWRFIRQTNELRHGNDAWGRSVGDSLKNQNVTRLLALLTICFIAKVFH